MSGAAFTRRQFVLVAAAAGGALVLGVAALRLQRRGGAGRTAGVLNAYVRIGPDERI